MDRKTIDEIVGDREGVLVPDGLEAAFLGLYDGHEGLPRAVFSVKKCLDIFIAGGMTYEEAREHFDFNVAGAYVGPQTPIFVEDEEVQAALSEQGD